jgi:cell division protein FtsB
LLLLSIILTIVLILRWFTAVRGRKLRSSFRRVDSSVSAFKKQCAALRAESVEVRNQLKHLRTRRGRLITEMDESREELRLLREEREQRERRIAA